MVLLGSCFGLFFGIFIQLVAGFPDDPLEIIFVNEVITWFSLFGNGYMQLVQMIVAPLVLISILHVIIHIDTGETMKKLVSRTLLITLLMVACSVITGLMVGSLFELGTNASLLTEQEATMQMREITPIATTLKNLIASNIFSALSNNHIIGIVIFSILLGSAIWWIHYEDEKLAKPLYTGIDLLQKTMVNMALLVLDYMPWAVIVLLANTIASRGLTSIIDVGKFIVALYIAMFVQLGIQLFLLFLIGLSPIIFLKKTSSILLMAFTTRSSVTCLPLTTNTLRCRLGVNEATANFVAGFGTTAGMQGCAGIFPALLIVYVCNATKTPIDLTMVIMSIIVITIGSIGIAGIPGTATLAASVSLSGVGMISSFPSISPILAIDPLIDMGRTLLNVSGSMVNALLIDKSLGSHNISEYYKD